MKYTQTIQFKGYDGNPIAFITNKIICCGAMDDPKETNIWIQGNDEPFIVNEDYLTVKNKIETAVQLINRA